MSVKVLILALLSLHLFSCMDDKTRKTPLMEMRPKELKNKLIEINKEFIENEDKAIESYADSLPHEFEKTGTGLRIAVYENSNGDSAKPGMQAIVNYAITDLQGNLIYQSEKDETQSFLIGKDNVERGLHEGIQKMTVGSKAIIILPAHLAHGLSGDNAKIPPQTALVYDLELVELK